MRYLFSIALLCGSICAADSVSITLDRAQITATVLADGAAVKAAYVKKKAETGLTDEQLRGYREVLIIDAVIESLKKSRLAAEQTGAERQAELAAQKAKLDAEYAARSALTPVVEVKP